ncbi:uncharacterized protein EDB93DRAFT_269730 [Suillus bovinus]|uniref:uncharacterized protein n=1 Tax=Suillus bovinus TaxID=48563 RepID=UPI001B86CEF3|nr:uncharacterized protein EDB93DRAFT_269730 [Suillus bovinus]KAG2151682.1 hypothetical protein EDB93DRAFT_269730 [Suillus bovinus]
MHGLEKAVVDVSRTKLIAVDVVTDSQHAFHITATSSQLDSRQKYVHSAHTQNDMRLHSRLTIAQALLLYQCWSLVVHQSRNSLFSFEMSSAACLCTDGCRFLVLTVGDIVIGSDSTYLAHRIYHPPYGQFASSHPHLLPFTSWLCLLSIQVTDPVEAAAVSDIAQPYAMLHAILFATQMTMFREITYSESLLLCKSLNHRW